MPTEKRHSQDCRMYAMICSEIGSSIFHERHVELCINIIYKIFIVKLMFCCLPQECDAQASYLLTDPNYIILRSQSSQFCRLKTQNSYVTSCLQYKKLVITLLFDSVYTDWFTYHIGGLFMPFSMRTKLKIKNFVFSHSSTCCFHFHWCSLCQVGRMLQWF